MLKLDNLDKFQKSLDKVSKQLEDLEETKTVPLEELLTDSFLSKYTDFSSLDELLKKCSINTNEDLENNIQLLDFEVKNNSNFSSWHEMLETAASEYYEEQISNIFK